MINGFFRFFNVIILYFFWFLKSFIFYFSYFCGDVEMFKLVLFVFVYKYEKYILGLCMRVLIDFIFIEFVSIFK